uniref:RING-type E3 ubiquitin transferase n=1 Tax=Kalanchoe fedtschenkoi TaxID=63787 RepID=A0A7N1A2M4_KALFE
MPSPPRPLRFLGDAHPSTSDTETPDSDFVVVLAALLCALICTLGLVSVARCAWLRRLAANQQRQHQQHSPSPAANKGLKKKVIRVLPKHTFSSSTENASAECPICLAEFVDGDELRALPLCRHEFHAACIDMWLQSRSSCPSCRRILTVERCEHCGQFASDSSSSSSCSSAIKERREADDNRFLP